MIGIIYTNIDCGANILDYNVIVITQWSLTDIHVFTIPASGHPTKTPYTHHRHCGSMLSDHNVIGITQWSLVDIHVFTIPFLGHPT